MPRVKRGVQAHAKHKKVLDAAKGYYGARRKVYRVAKQAVIKAGQYAYRDRRVKKREFRALWIQRINAAARLCDMLLDVSSRIASWIWGAFAAISDAALG